MKDNRAIVPYSGSGEASLPCYWLNQRGQIVVCWEWSCRGGSSAVRYTKYFTVSLYPGHAKDLWMVSDEKSVHAILGVDAIHTSRFSYSPSVGAALTLAEPGLGSKETYQVPPSPRL
jgi:hypothetical protein